MVQDSDSLEFSYSLRPVMHCRHRLRQNDGWDLGILQVLFSSAPEYLTLSLDGYIFCSCWCNYVLFFHKPTCAPNSASVRWYKWAATLLQSNISSMKAFIYYGLTFCPLSYIASPSFFSLRYRWVQTSKFEWTVTITPLKLIFFPSGHPRGVRSPQILFTQTLDTDL